MKGLSVPLGLLHLSPSAASHKHRGVPFHKNLTPRSHLTLVSLTNPLASGGIKALKVRRGTCLSNTESRCHLYCPFGESYESSILLTRIEHHDAKFIRATKKLFALSNFREHLLPQNGCIFYLRKWSIQTKVKMHPKMISMREKLSLFLRNHSAYLWNAKAILNSPLPLPVQLHPYLSHELNLCGPKLFWFQRTQRKMQPKPRISRMEKDLKFATGETSQAITPFHFFDYFPYFGYFHFFDYFHFFGYFQFFDYF